MGNLFSKKKVRSPQYEDVPSSIAAPSQSVDLPSYVCDYPVTSVCALPDGCLIGGKSKDVILYGYRKRQVVHRFSGHAKDVTKVRASRGERRYYASASRDTTVSVWMPDGEQVSSLKGHDLVVTGLAIPQADTSICDHIFTGSRDNSVRLWDVTSGTCVREEKISRNLVTDCSWRDGHTVAQTSEDKRLRLWDTRTMEVSMTFAIMTQILLSCDLSDQYIVTSSNGVNGTGGEVTLWDTRGSSLNPVQEFPGVGCPAPSAIFVPQQSTGRHDLIVSTSASGDVSLWSTTTRGLLSQVCKDQVAPLTEVSCYHDDSHVAVGRFGGGVDFLTIGSKPSDELQF